jgi:hypothetical protein
MTGQGLLPPSQLANQQAFGVGQVGASPFAIGLPVRRKLMMCSGWQIAIRLHVGKAAAGSISKRDCLYSLNMTL